MADSHNLFVAKLFVGDGDSDTIAWPGGDGALVAFGTLDGATIAVTYQMAILGGSFLPLADEVGNPVELAAFVGSQYHVFPFVAPAGFIKITVSGSGASTAVLAGVGRIPGVRR